MGRHWGPLVGLIVSVAGCEQSALPDGGSTGGGGGRESGGADAGRVFCLNSAIEEEPPRALATPPALSGGTLAALADGTLVAADPERDAVWLVSPDVPLVRRVDLQAGDEPGRVVEGPAGQAFVALRRAQAIAQVDVASGVVTRLSSCPFPRGLAFRPADQTLAVACLDGQLELLHLGDGARREALSLNPPLSDLRDVVVDGPRLLLSTFRAAQLYARGTDGTVVPLTEPASPADTTPHVAWRTVPAPGGFVMARQVHRSLVLPPSASCGAYGEHVGLFGEPDSGAGGGFGGGSGGGQASGGGGGPTPGVVSTEVLFFAADGGTSALLPGELSPMVLPADLATASDGRLAVLGAGVRSVLVMDGASSLRLDGLHQPTALAFRGPQLVVFEREPLALALFSGSGEAQRLSLPGGSTSSTGYELFHRATGARLACASCHPEAGEDGHVWPLFEGARRTPTLRGGLSTTLPFHWSGNEASMDALLLDVMAVRMDGPQQSPARSQALLDWLDGQPALPPPVTADAAAATRGKVLFDSPRLGCANCHVGTLGTNNQTMDVGTGEPLQVPRLVELARRAPWMHDGRMATWGQRFEPLAGGDAHGFVTGLSQAERDDLVAYLKTR